MDGALVDEEARQRDGSPFVGLGRAPDDAAAVDLSSGFLDGEATAQKINVPDPSAAKFRPAQAAICEDEHGEAALARRQAAVACAWCGGVIELKERGRIPKVLCSVSTTCLGAGSSGSKWAKRDRGCRAARRDPVEVRRRPARR